MTELDQIQCRDEAFYGIISTLNKRADKGETSFLFDCGDLGIVRVYWYRNYWEREWFGHMERYVWQ